MDPFIYKVQHNFGLIAIFYYCYKENPIWIQYIHGKGQSTMKQNIYNK